jgi:hypothetical protein
VDPLAGEYVGWSPFCFTLNNPIQLIDPDGMAPAPSDNDNEYEISIRDGKATTRYVGDRGGDQRNYAKVINYDMAPHKVVGQIPKTSARRFYKKTADKARVTNKSSLFFL